MFPLVGGQLHTTSLAPPRTALVYSVPCIVRTSRKRFSFYGICLFGTQIVIIVYFGWKLFNVLCLINLHRLFLRGQSSFKLKNDVKIKNESVSRVVTELRTAVLHGGGVMEAEDEEYYTESAYSYLTLCGEPTVLEGLKFAKDLILANLLLRLLIQYISFPHIVRHSLSLVIGGFLLYNNVGGALLWIVTLTAGSYATLFALTLLLKKRPGVATSSFVVLFLLMSEFLVIEPKMWQQIRGVQMIAAMKIISVSVDLDRGLFKRIPNPVEFAGYVLCPANCILGPWISFHKYDQYLDVRFLTRNWFKFIVVHLFIGLLCLVLSNCVIPWYIADDTGKWAVAYRDAQAFRASHYFVSSLSVVSMVSAGFALTPDCQLDLQVTRPLHIELPRSLVQVVVCWNIPMHQWLKNYVFKACQPHGQFVAVFITYVVSSLLHGLNFQLSAVLLSVGTFSYIEYKMRAKISTILNVCCLVNPCLKNCTHSYKNNSLRCRFLNLLFSFLAILHLAYLGVMFEASFSIQESGYSYSHTLSKWENLNFASHITAAFTYLIYLLI